MSTRGTKTAFVRRAARSEGLRPRLLRQSELQFSTGPGSCSDGVTHVPSQSVNGHWAPPHNSLLSSQAAQSTERVASSQVTTPLPNRDHGFQYLLQDPADYE